MDEFIEMLKDELKQTGRSLEVSVQELRQYVAERAAHLAQGIGQPGYQDMVRIERDNVVLAAGLKSVEEADAADQRIIGIIQAALGFLAAAA